ncbi:MAG: hypothetical protein AAB675_03155 [Patescibacteria group bacterium]
MNEFEKQFEQELMEQGTSGEELRDLTELKNNITRLSDVKRSYEFKKSFLRKLEGAAIASTNVSTSRRLFMPVLFLALLLIVLITGTVSAQASLPGQALYPVKILSENVIKTVNPSFNNEIIKRRSEEIKTLTGEKKNSKELNKTIDRYENDLEENKVVDPIKIEESKKNLEDARDNSEDEDKKEIENVINQTENKINESHEDNNENKSGDVKGAESSRGSNQDEEDKNQDKSGENKSKDNKD